MVVLDKPVELHRDGWKVVAQSDDDRYRMYKAPQGYYQISIVYSIDGRVYEKSVSNSRGQSFEKYLHRLDYFENEANYEMLIEEKERVRIKRSNRMTETNLFRMKNGVHQFQTNPEISKNGSKKAKQIWNNANNGIFECGKDREWTETKRDEKRKNNNRNRMKELWEKAKKGEYESDYHEEWTEKAKGNMKELCGSGFGNPCAIIEYNKTWNEGNDSKSLELRDKHISNAIKNIQNYNQKVKIDPILKKRRSEKQSETSKKNWKKEDYRRSVINGLLNAIEEGRWTPPYKNSKKGWHYSSKTGQSHFYRSSYEERMYNILDKDDNVVTYETECFRIEYYFENELHITIPDIFASYTNGEQFIIEVKTEYMLNDKLTLAKLTAMKEFSESEGYGFWLVTESVLDSLEMEEVLIC